MQVDGKVFFSNVAISISSFKSTESVINLLDKIFSSNILFSQVIVVDSLSDESLSNFIEKNKYNVKVFNAKDNIGSAGNLNKRMEIAAENEKHEWCFCINHDGYFNDEDIIKLLLAADNIKSKNPKVGAVFPNRVRNNTSKKKELVPTDRYENILWSSSNGSLYSLDPYRNGCKVREDLWMGWEDLVYCLQLKENDYPCFLTYDSIYYDSYEYQEINIFGKKFYIGDKPSWYNYYSIRNLILGLKNLESKSYLSKKIPLVLLKTIILTVFFKENKAKRLRLSFKGVLDGLHNRTGYIEIGIDK